MLSLLLSLLADPRPLEFTPQRGHAAVLHDRAADGSAWALSNTYKAGFDAAGAHVTPKLGARATRDATLHFRAPELFVGGAPIELAAAVLPTRSDDRVEFARGPLLEHWDLSLDGLEHSFVVPQPLGAGALVLRIPLAGAYTYRGRDGGLVFDAPEFGGLRYGDATVRAADGQTFEFESRCDGSAIVLEVPAAFAQQAAYPLVIDPLVSSFGIEQTGAIDNDSDLAYDVVNDVWLVVYTETITGADRDIVSRRLSATGALKEEVAVEISNDDTVSPCVAHNRQASQFMIVWARTGLIGRIQGRTRTASSTAQSAEFDISGASISAGAPCIGGSTSLTSTQYLVAWRSSSSLPGLGGVRTVLVGTTGSPTNEELVYHPSFGDIASLAINAVSSTSGRWLLAWNESSTFGGGSIAVAEINSGGVQVGSEHVIVANTTPSPLFPSVGGDGNEFLVAWERATGVSDSDIFGVRISTSGGFTLESGVLNLSQLEGDKPGVDQIDVDVACSGPGFAYTYRERGAGAANFDIYVSACSGTSSLDYAEKHVPVIVDPTDDTQPRLASRFEGGGTGGEFMGTWTRNFGGGSSDVDGFLYHDSGAGGVSIVQTGCGGFFEPLINISGAPIVGSNLSVLFIGSGSPLLILGQVAAVPLQLCPTQGGCSLGAFPIISLTAANTQSFQIPFNASLIGQKAALQGVRLNPLTFGPTCGPTDYPFPFRTSDTVVLTFK
jgi:hypothetical protein